VITTQVIDTSKGSPASRIPVDLDLFVAEHGWRQVGQGITNEAGIIDAFGAVSEPGIYRLSYDVAAYNADAFFPSIWVTFDVREPAEKYHLTLLLSPYGYSTYRS
jgi:5-hydroxyisourate hydrolase